jgi:hypothetical protein
MGHTLQYDELNDYNRFENLDSVEYKIISHLIYSTTSHANKIWKILKYDTIDALSQPEVSIHDRIELVCTDNGQATDKRVFLSPFTDDAWTTECSHIHFYIEGIYPDEHNRARIILGIETIVHSKISNIAAESDTDPTANPNDYVEADKEEQYVFYKNRETVLLKHVLAELNGLYIDGIGLLQFNQRTSYYSNSVLSLWNNRAYYGHFTKMACVFSGISNNASQGY